MKKTFFAAAATAVCMTAAAQAESHLIAVAACPNWKGGATPEQSEKMIAMCSADANNLASALQEKAGVKAENTHLLLQQDATPQMLDEKMQALAGQVGSDDLVYFYFALHGGVIDHTYKGYPVTDEVLAFYTEDQPADYSAAVAQGIWLGARDLRDRVSDFARNTDTDVIVLMEACHAGVSYSDFRHNPELHLDDDGKLAVIFSAREEEISHFNEDFSGGRFTTDFSQALRDAGDNDDMLDVFFRSTKTTFETTLNYCNAYDEDVRKKLLGNPTEFYEACTQEPTFYDPHGLLTNIVFSHSQ